MKKNDLLCILICFIVVSTCFFVTACTKAEDVVETSFCLTVSGPSVDMKYTLEDLKKLENGMFEGLYSTINNWPTAKTFAARGITIESILKDAGLYENAQVITIISKDGYKQSFTRNQMLDMKQYYYVDNKELSEVKSILAYEYKEDSTDLNEVKESKLCFIIGQTNYNEHTNPAFVEDVSELIISYDKPEKWDNVFTFPAELSIDQGEKVKLQHKDIGFVKIYYTLDGTNPTVLSNMYNVSTYQPELNVPIVVDKDTVIKAFVSGYGKEDSDVVTFEFKINR